PSSLQPPDGRLVKVTVSGKVSDGLSGPGGTLTYSIRDSYGQISTGGTISGGSGGNYSFSIALPAALNVLRTARTYTISVTGQDLAGNTKTVSTTVRVPRNGSGSLAIAKLSSALLHHMALLKRHR